MAKDPALDLIYEGNPLVLVFALPGIDADAWMMQNFTLPVRVLRRRPGCQP